MRILAHLVRTDFRRFRALIAAWLLMVVAGAVLAGVRPAITLRPGVPSPLGTITGLLWFATALVTIVMVTRIVQADSAVGSSSLWMTRPISGRLLLVAKTVTLAILIVAVPVVSEFALMLIYRVPLTTALSISAEAAVYQMLFVVILMTVAALTPDLSRFALACGAALGAVIVVLVVASYIDEVRRPSGAAPLLSSASDGLSSWLVFLVLTTLAGIVAIVLQYGTRRRAVAVAVAIAGFAFAWTTATVWPWRLLPAEAAQNRVPSWARGAQSLSLHADPESVVTVPNRFGFPPQPSTVTQAHVWLESIQPDYSANVSLASATWVANGREILSVINFGRGSSEVPISNADEPSSNSAIRHVLGVERFIDSTANTAERTVVFLITDDELSDVGAVTGEYVGRFRVALTHHRIDGAVSLRPGAEFEAGSQRIVVRNVEPRGGRIVVTLRESETRSMFDRVQRSQWRRYYLRHRGRSEALEGSADLEDDETFGRSFLPLTIDVEHDTGFRARARTISFPPRSGPGAGVLSIPSAEWLSGAELVRIDMSVEGTVERTLRIPNFRVGKRLS